MAVGKTGDGNPLKEDAALRQLLKQLDGIDTQREFRRWKVIFLERFEEYLHAEAIEQAEHNYHLFTLSLGKTSKLVKKLYTYLQNGDMTPPCPETGERGRITVMARKCLTDLQYLIEDLVEHLTGMLPATQSEEVELGYSKYHLGAVLIRDGFVEYDRLVICDEILQYMRLEALHVIADRIVLDQMEYYHDRLQMFCDVMADLGLYDAMVKCRQLLYLDEEDDDEKEGDGVASQGDEGYVPPIPVMEIAKEVKPLTQTATPSAEKLKAVKPAPTPIQVDTSTRANTTSALHKKKNMPPAPRGGLYARTKDDDDDSDCSDASVSQSSASKDSTHVTETSYFNDQPVWEQKKGENNKAYYNLNSYYHGNPADFLIGRKLRNQKKNGGDGDSDTEKNMNGDNPKSPQRENISAFETEKESKTESPPSSKKHKHLDSKASELSQSKDKTREPKKFGEPLRKGIKPLPQSYPPPPPKPKRSESNAQHEKKEEAVVPPSISFPVDDDDSEEEIKSSFLPSCIGGKSKKKKNRGRAGDDVEDLGMESAHGTALMSTMPRVPGMSRGTSFENGASDGDGSTSTRRLPRRGRKNGSEGDDASEGPPGWDAVLGPTDRTGRPSMHRGMSIMSLHPDGNDDDNDSALPESSLLAPKKASLEAQMELMEEDEEDEEKVFIPLTPSQVKDRQNPKKESQSPENEEDSNETSPTVSSTMEDENPDKSRDKAKSSKEQRLFLKRTDNRGTKTSVSSSRTSDAPLLEIKIPDVSVEFAAQKPLQKPKFASDDLDAGNPAHHKHSPSHYGGNARARHKGVRGGPMESSTEPPNASGASPGITDVSMDASNADPKLGVVRTKTEEGLKDFSKPRRTGSGLKDYSRTAGPPPRTKSGLKDYSKRGRRTINTTNTQIGSENDLTKEKQSLADHENKSMANGDMLRKPKKELKISMNTKEPKLSAPPSVKEVSKPEKVTKKGRKKEKQANKEKRDVPLTEEEKVLMRKKCYMWYARMGQPDRENMKRRVAALPPHCNIYVEDVDLLPWICFGTVLSVKAMNELFMGEDAE